MSITVDEEHSESSSVHHSNQGCKRAENNSEMKLMQSVFKTEIMGGFSQRGPVQTRFFVRKTNPNWLVKGAIKSGDCRHEITLGEGELTRNQWLAKHALPGSVDRVASRANKRIARTVILRTKWKAFLLLLNRIIF